MTASHRPFRQSLLIARVLWGALLFSTVIYLVVLITIAPETTGPATGPHALVFAAIGITLAGTSIGLPPILYNGMLRRAGFETTDIPDEKAEAMFRDQQPTRRVFQSPDFVKSRAAQIALTPNIIGLAMAESIAICGFVLGFLGQPLNIVLMFFLAAWTLMIPRFPTARRALEPVERVYQARLD